MRSALSVTATLYASMIEVRPEWVVELNACISQNDLRCKATGSVDAHQDVTLETLTFQTRVEEPVGGEG